VAPSDDRIDDYSAFDLNEKNHRRNIESVWARMREQETLPYSGKYGGYYILTRYEDVALVARNAKAFSSAENGIAMPDLHAESRLIPVESDPPFHSEYRSLFVPFVTKEAIQKHESTVRTVSIELLNKCAELPSMDFVGSFARPFPAFVILTILGIPDRDIDRLAGLIDTAIDGAEEEGRGGPQAIKAAQEFSAYLDQVLAGKRGAPFDPANVISAIVHSSLPSAPLGPKEQNSLLKILIFGGFTTTTFALTSAMRWLVEHPGDLERLRATPRLLATAVEEFVRFASPGTYTARTVMTDITIRNTDLHKGDRVVMCQGAANRDPTVFERPEEIVLDRTPNQHLGFGRGPHGCMGLHLARLELHVALEECLKRLGDYALDPTHEIKWASGETQGMLTLPLLRR
jgi:cytochrome P450